MDNKSYNVDDILAEIKSRKLREKRDETAGRTSYAPVKTAPASVADRTPEKPRETEAMRVSGHGLAEPAQIKPEPVAEPAAKVETRPVPEAGLKPDINPEQAVRIRPEPKPVAEPKPAAHTPVIKREPRLEKPVKKKFDALNFDDEDVVSITERARSRSSHYGMRAPVQSFEFEAEDNPETEEIDEPGRFATASFAPAIERSAGMERTRVIPALSASRDLQAEDIRQMDFSRLAAESQTGFYFEDDASDTVPEGSVIDYSEYNSVNDRRDVQTDIARVKLWLFIRVSLTFIFTAALFTFTLGGKIDAIPLPELLFPVPETMRAYLIACTVLTILVALVNSATVGGGLIGLFKMHANSDTLAACAILSAIGQGVIAVANKDVIEPAALNLYFCIAALALLFNGFGKMTMINRILSNFRVVASDQSKKALMIATDDDFCHEFFKDEIHRPTIVHSVKAGFFTDFLGISYSDKYDVGVNRVVAPVCLAGSIMVAVATYFLTRSMLSAISAMTAILCVCATLSTTFIENVPLAKLAKKLTPQGGTVSGCKAVDDFCDARAVILSENELFPRGHVQLHGIRAFSQARIDEAILDAASVLCKVNGALGPVFLEMIGGNRKLLKKVDNIVFENAMGISAWVDGRRVLIGNRMLMDNHGIALPAEVTDKARVSSEAEPLFLSNSGEACAQFTVGYRIDEELALELDNFARRDKLLIVYTTDANITEEKLNELYGYPLELIQILPADRHTAYKKMTEPRETAMAGIVYTGKASIMVKAILACMAARSSILSATIIQLIQIVLGYAFCTFLAFMGQIGTLTILQVCVYQIFWFFAIFIVQQARQS